MFTQDCHAPWQSFAVLQRRMGKNKIVEMRKAQFTVFKYCSDGDQYLQASLIYYFKFLIHFDYHHIAFSWRGFQSKVKS